MREQVEALEAEYAEVETQLASPAVIGDPERLQAAGRRFKELEQVLAVGRPLSRAQDDLETARELAEEAESDERELLRNEMADLEADIERLEGELRALRCAARGEAYLQDADEEGNMPLADLPPEVCRPCFADSFTLLSSRRGHTRASRPADIQIIPAVLLTVS